LQLLFGSAKLKIMSLESYTPEDIQHFAELIKTPEGERTYNEFVFRAFIHAEHPELDDSEFLEQKQKNPPMLRIIRQGTCY